MKFYFYLFDNRLCVGSAKSSSRLSPRMIQRIFPTVSVSVWCLCSFGYAIKRFYRSCYLSMTQQINMNRILKKRSVCSRLTAACVYQTVRSAPADGGPSSLCVCLVPHHHYRYCLYAITDFAIPSIRSNDFQVRFGIRLFPFHFLHWMNTEFYSGPCIALSGCAQHKVA